MQKVLAGEQVPQIILTPSVVVTPDNLADYLAGKLWTEPVAGAIWRHGYTYSGHATACAAAMANLDLLAQEGLIERVVHLEPRLAAAVEGLVGAPLVGDVRSVGLMAAVELARPVLAADPGAIERVVVAMRKRGVLSRSIGGRAIQISPAFVIEPGEIDRIVEVVGAALQEVAAGL